MSSNGPNDPPHDDASDKAAPPRAQSKRANQLFGHKGGASPWEKPEGDGPASPATEQRTPTTSSAAYPADAQYASRDADETERAPETRGFLSDVDDEAELTKLHPNYKFMMRVSAIILALVLMIIAVVADELLSSEFGWPFGLITGPAFLLALFLVIRIPGARYNARGYQISRDRLRVVRGIMWHSDTIVPFGRVQHIDVDQGPIERALGIATMTLHTAGSHNASVHLPGLGHELAVEMREEIRAHIKRESL